MGRHLLGLLALAALTTATARTTSAATIRPDEAAAHAGREVTVEGYVERVVCSSRACLLSFGAGFSGLVVSLPAAVGKSLPPAREQYENRSVRVTGVVTMPQDRPRIELDDASDIERVDLAVGVVGGRTSTRTDAGDGTSQAGAPGERPVTVHASTESKGAAVAEIVRSLERENQQGGGGPASEATSGLAARVKELEERVGEAAPSRPGMLPLTDTPVPLAQPDDLAELRDQLARLDESIASLSDGVAALADRVVALEGAMQQLAATPQLPDYIIPGERPPKLNRVRRGWSADRVLRTLGQPTQVVGTAGGPVTWLYAGGRSVTIDERGRVTAAAGF